MSITFNEGGLQRLADSFWLAAQNFPEERKKVLTAIGIQVASWAMRDFRALSEGNSVPDGRKWKELTDSAIRTRLAARAPYQRLTQQLQEIRESERPLLEALRRKMKKGKGDPKFKRIRGAIARQFTEANPQLAEFAERKRGIRAKRNDLVKREKEKAKIGIDTGRLVNSIVYGVDELRVVRPPKAVEGEPPPPAEFQLVESMITLGSNLNYAEYFDELRPIFPEEITGDRKSALEKLATNALERAVADRLRKEGLAPQSNVERPTPAEEAVK